MDIDLRASVLPKRLESLEHEALCHNLENLVARVQEEMRDCFCEEITKRHDACRYDEGILEWDSRLVYPSRRLHYAFRLHGNFPLAKLIIHGEKDEMAHRRFLTRFNEHHHLIYSGVQEDYVITLEEGDKEYTGQGLLARWRIRPKEAMILAEEDTGFRYERMELGHENGLAEVLPFR